MCRYPASSAHNTACSVLLPGADLFTARVKKEFKAITQFPDHLYVPSPKDGILEPVERD